MGGSFYPQRRTLLGPGPSDVSDRVLSAAARPTIGHLDPQFIVMMDEIKDMLRFAFKTENELTFPVSAPGSAGMEACFVNLLEPGDTAIVCQNGVFGCRMVENVRRLGANCVLVEDKWGCAVDLAKVEEALARNPDAKVLAFVHAETSTGVRSDARALCELAREYGCLTIVDTVTSLGGIDVDVDGWGADAVYSGTQKCLSGLPGVSPVSFGIRAREAIENRKAPVQSWFLDVSLVMGYWGGGEARAYHHTAPINALYALHETLLMLKEEGLERAWARHEVNHRALRAGLEALGLELVVDGSVRLPQLNVVSVPAGVDEKHIRTRLLDHYNIEIGAGLGAFSGKVWRIGLMGQASKASNVRTFISALENELGNCGLGIARGAGVNAVDKTYGK